MTYNPYPTGKYHDAWERAYHGDRRIVYRVDIDGRPVDDLNALRAVYREGWLARIEDAKRGELVTDR
jgi:hypothetical protein